MSTHSCQSSDSTRVKWTKWTCSSKLHFDMTAMSLKFIMVEDQIRQIITTSVLLLFFITTTTANCLVEEGKQYHKDPTVGTVVTVSDWQSCRSHCTANQPSTTYFQYNRNGKCRCKSSKSGRKSNSDYTSGDTNCMGKWFPVSQKEVQLVE